MKLNLLSSVSHKTQRRLGQGHGSGRGKTAGRGTKGQKARGDIPLQFEGGALPLIKRLPFIRGKGKNDPWKRKPVIIQLNKLHILPKNAVVDIDTLIKHGIIDERAKTHGVKLLSDGEVGSAYTIKIPTSRKAQEKITQAGGTIEATQ